MTKLVRIPILIPVNIWNIKDICTEKGDGDEGDANIILESFIAPSGVFKSVANLSTAN